MSDAASSKTSFSITSSIRAIPTTDWDRLAGGDDPFVAHAFLRALEESGSVAESRGWQPCHLVMNDSRGRIVGVAPLYRKTHSRGEFVFDQGWADAYERILGPYYPKLQLCIPFSPVTGRRLLTGTKGAEAHRHELVAALRDQAQKMAVSSVHATFLNDAERSVFEDDGWMTRIGYQFHWFNQNYRSFDDFLAALTSRKRKMIRRERREAASHGFSIQMLHGQQISATDWHNFYDLYLNTIERKWALAYLTPEFFRSLGDGFGEHVLMIAARDSRGRLVAAALNLIGRMLFMDVIGGLCRRPNFCILNFAIIKRLSMRLPMAWRGLKRAHKGSIKFSAAIGRCRLIAVTGLVIRGLPRPWGGF